MTIPVDVENLRLVIQVLLILGAGYLVRALVSIIFPPLGFPRNIPTIPFYVSFVSFFTNMDQGDVYEKYLRNKLEKHGAVKIYFASRWNILVTKPLYLSEIFKNDNIYAKSGNQEKIPYSVLAEYTGDNIISAHGEDWKLYRSICSKLIQSADTSKMKSNTEKMMDIIATQIDQSKSGPVPMTDIIQRYTLQNVGQSVLGVDFHALDDGPNQVHARVKFVKRHIFSPLFMNFPILDKLPLSLRLLARKVVREFRVYLGLIASEAGKSNGDFAFSKLLDALKSGLITEKQFIDNVVILMVAGHENPLLLILSLLFVLAKHQNWQQRVRAELKTDKDNDTPVLSSVVYETLRMYPPLGQIINRRTTRRVRLGGHILIPSGTYVGYNNYATGRDRGTWGEDADDFKPERWGSRLEEIEHTYLTAKRTSTLPAFHGRKRACLGEKFALNEAKACVASILTQYRVTLDKKWAERLTPAGPICPLMLVLNFEEV